MSHPSDSFLEASDAKFGRSALLTFASFCFFNGLQMFISGMSLPLRVKNSNNHWMWNNLTVSFSHSLLMTLLLSYSFYSYPDLVLNALTFHNSYVHAIICFTAGYFMWDLYDIVQTNRFFKSWEVTIHHAGVLSILAYNLVTTKYAAFSIIALTVEANSVFLHTRKLLQMSGVVSYSSWIYVKVCQVNLFTFVVFRGTVLFYVTWAMVHYFDFMATSYINIMSSVLFTSWPMNVVLLWRLIKSDVLRNAKKNESCE